MSFLTKIFGIQQISKRKNDVEPHAVSKLAYKEIMLPVDGKITQPFLYTFQENNQQNNYEAYFNDGILFDVKPRNKSISLYEDRGIAYKARYIISDGKKYDLENAESVKSIQIPTFNAMLGMQSPTFDLGYILKIRVGVEYRPELTVPLAYKTASLMMTSPFGWGKKDFYRLVIQLWSVGENYYADYLLDQLKKALPFVAAEDEIKCNQKEYFDRQLQFGNEFNQNLIQIGFLGSTCSQCAPYQNRIYSIDGSDKRFPVLPKFIWNNKGLHCGNSIHTLSYYEGKTMTKYCYDKNGNFKSVEVDAIKYSNRPFVDDRSENEKANFESHTEKERKRKEYEAKYYSREHWIEEYKLRVEYHNIVLLLGERAPKNFNAYKRMKIRAPERFS